MNILLGIREIAGYQTRLSGGLRELGHTVTLIEIGSNPCDYKNNPGGALAAWTNKTCKKFFLKRNASFIHKIFWKLLTEFLKPVIFLWSIPSHTHYLFVFGESFLPFNIDVLLLRAFGRKVGFVYLGSDSRPPYLDFGGVYDKRTVRRSITDLRHLVLKKRRKIKRLDKWSNFTVDNPASAHLHVGKVINWYYIGFPVEGKQVELRHGETGIQALHAPSHLAVKGTAHISAAAEALTLEFPNFRLIQISGRPQSEVIAAVKNSDFVVDQLYSDTPCAGFAAEAAAMGLPAVVGGYGWSDAWLKVSGLGEYPSSVCHPDEIYAAMRRMVTDSVHRDKIRSAAIRRATLWTSRSVAERIVSLFRGEVPEQWYFEPKDVPAFYSGVGLDDKVVAQVVYELVKQYGWEALQLNHNVCLISKAEKFLSSHGYFDLPEVHYCG